jgi:hypothetical protein
MLPLFNSGKPVEKLNYKGSKEEHLSDEDVQKLSKALCANNKFFGKLKLDKNGISDLAILAVSEVLRKPDFQNIKELSLEGNPDLTCKAGEYIGQALIDNCANCKLKELDFDGIDLGQRGLVRIIDAANKTPSLEKLNVGVLTDNALLMLAERLKDNKYLLELKFEETEDHQQYWSKDSQKDFCELLKSSTQLKKIKAKFQKCNWKQNPESKDFIDEIEFYTDQKSKCQKQAGEFEERMRSCDQEQTFQQMIDYLDSKSKNAKMPVRNFYDNTFGQILNDAIFALKRRQTKSTGEEANELQHHTG